MTLRRFIRPFYCRPADGEGGDLGAPSTVVEAPAAVEAPSPAPVESSAPAAAPSMLDALNKHFNRDELGRFASPAEKAAAEAAQAAAAGVQKPATDPNAPEDITAMPEGLGQKAQERFQRLAGTVKELTQQTQSLTEQVGYVRDTFQQHGITQPQFEQAASVLGMLNRGDYRGALTVLDQQRQQIALQLGEALPGVDALAQFPELRQKVDGLMMTEADALQMAKMMQTQGYQQQLRQQWEQNQQQQQAAQQSVRSAQGQVDTWWKQTAASDLDAPVIEAQLLPHIPALLQGVPPEAWVGVIQAQYKILKQAAGTFRHQSNGAPAPLRPTGSGAQPQQRPGSMYEAMWNRPRA